MASDDAHTTKTTVNERLRGPDGTFVNMKVQEKGLKDTGSIDDPLVSVKIQNPFKKLLHWIDQIRRKQETVFSIQLKLPLVVIITLFLMILGAATSSKIIYDWGKFAGVKTVLANQPNPAVIILPTATPAPVGVTRLGTLKGSYTLPVEANPEGTETVTMTPSRYILEDRDGGIVFVVPAPQISLQTYMNKRLLVTGMYDSMKNSLTVAQSRDIEVIR